MPTKKVIKTPTSAIVLLIAYTLFLGCDTGEPKLGTRPVEHGNEVVRGNASGVNNALLDSARNAFPQELSSSRIAEVFQTGLWNSNRTAVAVSIPRTKPKASLIFVFLQQTNSTFLATDASGVEGGNLGKLGDIGLKGYDRYETTPVKWLHRADDYFQVEMRTRAWKDGQRYTVSEPLVIKPDGFVLYR